MGSSVKPDWKETPDGPVAVRAAAEARSICWPNFKRTVDGIEGLITVVVQDIATREVLMVAYANEEAWTKTLETGNATFYTTSRRKLWMKGEESGNVMKVQGVTVDCDGDTVIYFVIPLGEGAACHTGAPTCFYRGVLGMKQMYAAPKAGPKEVLSVRDFPVHGDIQF